MSGMDGSYLLLRHLQGRLRLRGQTKLLVRIASCPNLCASLSPLHTWLLAVYAILGVPSGPQSKLPGQKKKKNTKKAATYNKAVTPQHLMAPSSWVGGLMSNYVYVLCLSLFSVDVAITVSALFLTQVWRTFPLSSCLCREWW